MTSPAQQASVTDTAARRRVVVGVDDSQPARHALQWAQFMALTFDADIEAIAAWEITSVEAEEWSDDIKPEQETSAQLQSIVAEALGEPRVTIREVISHGHAADQLIGASKGAQMLIVGTKGHGGLHDLLVGSVSSASVARAHCPVLVIHGDTPPPPGPA
jgi:nucleotide-binding universal stress UspA family protein